MAGVVAALSVTSDLTRGHPPGEAMRACLLAGELARRSGLEEGERGDVYYATLLRFAGCAATSHELAAALGGDDVVVRARGDMIDAARPRRRCGCSPALEGERVACGRSPVRRSFPGC
jgi:hypothetical protein